MIFRFMRAKSQVDTKIETLKLRLEMVDCLLKHRFTWEEIERGLGFSEGWYLFTKRLVEKNQK